MRPMRLKSGESVRLMRPMRLRSGESVRLKRPMRHKGLRARRRFGFWTLAQRVADRPRPAAVSLLMRPRVMQLFESQVDAVFAYMAIEEGPDLDPG